MTSRIFYGPKVARLFGLLVFLSTFAFLSIADDVKSSKPQEITHRIMGLCCLDRQDDLRAALKKMKGVELVRIDFDRAEATVLYDPVRLFPQDKEDRYNEVFNNLLRASSDYTFELKSSPSLPQDKLTLVEIAVIGLDCKGCCLGTYNAVARLEGVDRATACSKRGLVTAWIDPSKTNREALEKALKNAGVTLKTP